MAFVAHSFTRKKGCINLKKFIHWSSFLLLCWLALGVFAAFVGGDLDRLFSHRRAESFRIGVGIYAILLFVQWQFFKEVAIFPWNKKNTNDD